MDFLGVGETGAASAGELGSSKAPARTITLVRALMDDFILFRIALFSTEALFIFETS